MKGALQGQHEMKKYARIDATEEGGDATVLWIIALYLSSYVRL
jgi:hypothetical protein